MGKVSRPTVVSAAPLVFSDAPADSSAWAAPGSGSSDIRREFAGTGSVPVRVTWPTLPGPRHASDGDQRGPDDDWPGDWPHATPGAWPGDWLRATPNEPTARSRKNDPVSSNQPRRARAPAADSTAPSTTPTAHARAPGAEVAPIADRGVPPSAGGPPRGSRPPEVNPVNSARRGPGWLVAILDFIERQSDTPSVGGRVLLTIVNALFIYLPVLVLIGYGFHVADGMAGQWSRAQFIIVASVATVSGIVGFIVRAIKPPGDRNG